MADDGVVYFDVQSFPEYGRLSGNTPDQIRSGQGGRVDEATQAIKRHPADFMLWKPDPKHLMRWESPWGEGYPGWHLECSVMAGSLLGKETNSVIDFHSGGEDNIFPHHECEIAQSCGVSDETLFARFWFHTRFLIVEGEKMSKSKGNFFTVRDVLEKGATPAALRLELIKTHYRSNANFTFQGLTDSQQRPDPKHLMRWESPWGEGYPGWHLECSVMAGSLLGKETNSVIDFHSGGEDNIFPHHECEIAQSCGVSDETLFARFWFHTRFLIVEGEKMSKSKGNFFTVRDVLEKGATPAALRLELIKTHYRSNANFTFQGLTDSQRQIDRWKKLEAWLSKHAKAKLDGPGPLVEALPAFKQALRSDLNLAGAIGALSSAAGMYAVDADPPEPASGNTTYADELEALQEMNSVLGVLDLEWEQAAAGSSEDAALIESKITNRNLARDSKDWATADRIRDELLEMNIAIKDGPKGTTWKKIVK